MTSYLEEHLARLVEQHDLPPPVREYKFAAPTRQWRFDFAWPDFMIAVELDGGTFVPKGYHSSGPGFETDARKCNTAMLMGWRVLHYTRNMLKDGTAARELDYLFGGGDEPYRPPLTGRAARSAQAGGGADHPAAPLGEDVPGGLPASVRQRSPRRSGRATRGDPRREDG